MEIILNEYEWAEQAIAEHKLGSKPMDTLTRVAKYYMANQYSRNDVRDMLDIFLTKCDPDASLVQWSDTLDRVVKAAASGCLGMEVRIGINSQWGDFPRGPVAETLCSQCRGPGFDPWTGN